jgi:hypothetical protein
LSNALTRLSLRRSYCAAPAIDSCGAEVMGEFSASTSGIFIDKGYRMMEILLGI